MKYRRIESDNSNPILSRLISMIELNRKRLYDALEGVTDEMLSFSPDLETLETIGTLLEHIQGVEWSWIFEDIDGKEMDYETWKYAFPLRPNNKIGQEEGRNLDYYKDKLELNRKEILERLKKFNDSDLQQEFIADEVVNFTLEWVFFHLLNHEAMHIGQIYFLKRLYKIK